jgi:nucleotide-binding universal stress UspA family protein
VGATARSTLFSETKEDTVKTIVLATDGSPSALKATTAAVELAAATGGRLRIVAVWRVPAYSFGYAAVDWTPELIEAERVRAQEVVEAALRTAGEVGVVATATLRQGDPAGEICAAAEETRAAMIVMGAHGWGPLKRLVFGSVSTRVLHESPCPVLVVRGVEPVDDASALAAVGAVA